QRLHLRPLQSGPQRHGTRPLQLSPQQARAPPVPTRPLEEQVRLCHRPTQLNALHRPQRLKHAPPVPVAFHRQHHPLHRLHQLRLPLPLLLQLLLESLWHVGSDKWVPIRDSAHPHTIMIIHKKVFIQAFLLRRSFFYCSLHFVVTWGYPDAWTSQPRCRFDIKKSYKKTKQTNKIFHSTNKKKVLLAA
ncbi:Hypothetical protein, putative, partial [Bodo saltans]